jgi:hypothetical protein
MSEPTAPALRPRPVSLATILVILAVLGLFLFLVDMTYLRSPVPAPQNQAADNLGKDQAWKATPETRIAYLAELKAKQAKQGASYGWVDQKTGVVQLPIERAVELVIQEQGAAK